MRYALIALFAACGGSQVVEHHESDLSKALPATLEAPRPRDGEPRTMKVRVWVDPAVRALPRWKEDITDQLDYAGQLLVPLLGVRLQVDAIKDWDHVGDLHGAIGALAKTDDGKDVAWVIGYVAPADIASKAMGELGEAQVLGHYIAIRAWAEKPETDALAAILPDLKPEERAEAITAHKRHKQAVVLLHMLAETLGAIDEADPTWIQHPLYSPKQSTFSDRNRELMQLAVDARITDEPKTKIAHDLLENIERTEWGGWIPTNHDEVVTQLRAVVDAARAGKTASDVPTAAYDEFDRIQELAKKGDTKDALNELDNLLTAYPANGSMHELKCEILIAKAGVNDKQTRAACARVTEVAPGDPSPHLAIGEALIKAGDLAGAHTELAKAQAKIANVQPAGAQADAWRRLVGIYAGTGALSWADEAITAGKLDADPVAAQIASQRARFGIPRGTKTVKPQDEGALVTAIRGALELVYAGKYPEAERALATAQHRWPAAAGVAAARCDLEVRRGAIDEARALCGKALATDPADSSALYLAALIELRDTSGTKPAIEKLKKAIAVDPDLAQAWRALGKVYAERTKDQTAFQALDQAYQAKFGQALPY